VVAYGTGERFPATQSTTSFSAATVMQAPLLYHSRVSEHPFVMVFALNRYDTTIKPITPLFLAMPEFGALVPLALGTPTLTALLGAS